MKLYPMIGISQPRTDTVKRAAEILKGREMPKPVAEPVRPMSPKHLHKSGSRWRGASEE